MTLEKFLAVDVFIQLFPTGRTQGHQDTGTDLYSTYAHEQTQGSKSQMYVELRTAPNEMVQTINRHCSTLCSIIWTASDNHDHKSMSVCSDHTPENAAPR